METILRQESLTELGVAQPTIIILVESCHEKSNFIILYLKPEGSQPMDQILDRGSSWSRLIEDLESINQVEISFETEGNFNLFNVPLELNLILEHIEDMAVCTA